MFAVLLKYFLSYFLTFRSAFESVVNRTEYLILVPPKKNCLLNFELNLNLKLSPFSGFSARQNLKLKLLYGLLNEHIILNFIMSMSGMSDITSINLLSKYERKNLNKIYTNSLDISGDDSSDSNQGASGSASDTTQKPRNIAVKKGAPVPQPPQMQFQRKGSRLKGQGLQMEKEGNKFLADFNPENSRREKNKRFNLVKPAKPVKSRGQQSMYDEQGKIRYNKQDICDCFDSDCPGCHFSCELCGSQKCGLRCRVNRRWAFEVIEHDGKDQVKTNSLLTTISYRN
jgi:ARF7 effector protein C-terminus